MTGPEDTGHPVQPEITIEGERIEEPEVEILDGDEEVGPEELSDLAAMANVKIPLIMRFFFVIFAFFASMWLAFSAFCWCLCGAANAVTGFRVEEINRLTKRFWKGLKRATTITLGLVIGAFSPQLGLSFIMLYFMLHEEGDSAMAEMLRSNVNKYSESSR